MTKDEALRLALEYVELVPDDRYSAEHIDQDALITTIKAALEAKDEPVGVFREDDDIGHVDLMPHQQMKLKDGDLVYTTPPQRTWVALTDEEISDCMEMSIQKTCRAIEAKLKEKNT